MGERWSHKPYVASSILATPLACVGLKIRHTCKVKLRQLCHCAESGEIHGEVKMSRPARGKFAISGVLR